MKRQAVIALCVLLAGCARLADMDSDAFAPGQVPQERFLADSRACDDKAEAARSYEMHGIAADNANKHRVFSRAYAACMTAKGYRERTGPFNFWEAYDF